MRAILRRVRDATKRLFRGATPALRGWGGPPSTRTTCPRRCCADEPLDPLGGLAEVPTEAEAQLVHRDAADQPAGPTEPFWLVGHPLPRVKPSASKVTTPQVANRLAFRGNVVLDASAGNPPPAAPLSQDGANQLRFFIVASLVAPHAQLGVEPMNPLLAQSEPPCWRQKGPVPRPAKGRACDPGQSPRRHRRPAGRHQ